MPPENSPEISSFDSILGATSSGFSFPAMQSLPRSSYEYQVEASERASAASENHKLAERKRRLKINSHLDSLRALLLCNSKTDKASLLAKVVERVRELKQQTSEIIKSNQTFPSEADELIVRQSHESYVDHVDGKSFIKATLCCEDRVDLIPDLMEILKSMPLHLVRAEMATLGGRIRNVIVVVGENEDQTDELVLLLRDALKTCVLRSDYDVEGRVKRQRMFDRRMTAYE